VNKKDDCSRGDSDSPSELLTRLDKLEESLAYAQSELDQLSTALSAQDKRIERLERLIEVMASRIKQGVNSGIESFDPEVDRPPHF